MANDGDEQIIGIMLDRGQISLDFDKVKERMMRLILSTRSSKEDVAPVACDEEYSELSS